jgi:hypothetical protein
MVGCWELVLLSLRFCEWMGIHVGAGYKSGSVPLPLTVLFELYSY